MSQIGKIVLSLIAPAMICLAAPVANADTITFNNDPTGLKPGGFQSVDSPIVRFSNPHGSLFLATLSTFQTTSNALITVGSGDGVIVMDFSHMATSLSFDFGHNLAQVDPQLRADAILILFANDVQVGQALLSADNNFLVDQRFSFAAGVAFDRAVFSIIAHGPANDFGIAEVVDNIKFTPVPEPATTLLFGTGLAGVIGTVCRRRKFRR